MTETTVLGAAHHAGLAVGYWSSVDEMPGTGASGSGFAPSIFDDRREEHYDG